jgi:hypothetical protein
VSRYYISLSGTGLPHSRQSFLALSLCLSFMFFFLIFLLGIFLIYISNVIPKFPHSLPPTPLPTHSHFFFFFFPVLEHIKFACPMGLSFQRWPTRPSFDTYAARDKSSGVLVSSYCCFFNSLEIFHFVNVPHFLYAFFSGGTSRI